MARRQRMIPAGPMMPTQEADMYGVKMFNANGVQLYREAYDARSGEFGREYVLECDTLETARWVPGQHRSAHRPEGQRNRIEYFEITGPDGALIETVYPYNETRESPYRQGVKYSTRRFRTVPASQGDAPAVSAAPAPESPAAPLAPGSGPYDETGNVPSSECETPASDYYAAPDGFEVNPYWGDLESILVILVCHAETGAYGLAVHGGDGTGRADGRQVDFVSAGHVPTSALYPALTAAGYDEGRTFIVNYFSPVTVSADEWTRMNDASEWPASSEKFSNGLAERLHDASLDSGQDETLGESDGFGWFALFASDHAILSTDSQGFVGAVHYGSEQEARDAWSELERDYERFCMAGMEDALPTSECDEIFLIFDTARHVNSVPDRDEIREHVHQCRICLSYRYTLDEF